MTWVGRISPIPCSPMRNETSEKLHFALNSRMWEPRSQKRKRQFAKFRGVSSSPPPPKVRNFGGKFGVCVIKKLVSFILRVTPPPSGMVHWILHCMWNPKPDEKWKILKFENHSLLFVHLNEQGWHVKHILHFTWSLYMKNSRCEMSQISKRKNGCCEFLMKI